MSEIDTELLKLVDVMISSTTKDLPHHRQEAMTAIRRAGMRPIWMEDLSATSNSDAIKESLKMVDEAEIYVGILGYRYGFIPDDHTQNPQQVSITELEYQHAIARNLPIYIFMIDPQHPLPSASDALDFYESNPIGKEKLAAFKGNLAKKHIVKWFTSAEDLRASLYQSLKQDLLEIQRAVQIAVAKTQVSLPNTTLPIPPQMYVVSEYNLRSIRFVGRKQELTVLDNWAQSSKTVCVVEAIGGMGKSSLTWHWTQDRAIGFDGIFWYSFYEDGTTMNDWSRHAYAYITRQNPENLKDTWKASREQLSHLLHLIRQKRYLFVMDGFERVLVAYHRWNTAQMQDDTIDDVTHIFDKHRDMRMCTNPNDSNLLQLLVDSGNSKLLMTTRLFPREFEEAGRPRIGVERLQLKGLAPDDAQTYLRVLGTQTTSPTTLDMFMRQLGYHTLLLRIVAGAINEFRAARGDFDRWYERVGRDFRLTEWDAKQKRHHILKFAFDGLDSAHQRLLSQIAAFGGAVSYDTLLILNPFFKPPISALLNPMDSIAFEIEYIHHQKSLETALSAEEGAYHRAELEKLQAEIHAYHLSLESANQQTQYPKTTEYKRALMQFEEMLAILEERGLLEYNRDTDLYDLHPVIRGFAYDQLDDQNRHLTHDKIVDYYTQQPRKRQTEIYSLEDLKSSIQLYRALVNAGRLDDASDFFGTRLATILSYNLGAYHLIVELLSPLFLDGITQMPSLKNFHVQLGRISNMTTALHYLGRYQETLALEELVLYETFTRRNYNAVANVLRNYALTLRATNQLYRARVASRLALELAVVCEYTFGIVVATLNLISLYMLFGDIVSARRAYGELNDMWDKIDDGDYWRASGMLVSLQLTNALGKMTVNMIEATETFAKKAKNGFVLRQIPLIWGEYWINQNELEKGRAFIETAIKMAHESGDTASLKSALTSLMRLKIIQKQDEAIRHLLQEELDDLAKAEGYQYFSELDMAQTYAIKAYQQAWADGEPYVRYDELHRAKQLLHELGVTPPRLPMFNEKRIEKMPYEDAIADLIDDLKRRKGNLLV
jgi:hypothetical protein